VPAGLNKVGMQCYVGGSDLYYVRIDLQEDRFSLYAEYEWGDEVDREEFKFSNNKFGSFLKAYVNSIEWAKEYVNPD